MRHFLPPSLKFGKTGIGEGIEKRLERLADKFELPEKFTHFDPESNAGLLSFVHEFRRRIDRLETPSKKEVSRKRSLLSHDARKPTEAIAVAYNSGLLEETGDVHMHDFCAGTGLVSIGSYLLRKGKTVADCWEINMQRGEIMEELQEMFKIQNSPLKFHQRDIHTVAPGSHQEKATYWISKHACGELATCVLQKLRGVLLDSEAVNPKGLCISTCCHGNLKKHVPDWLPDAGLTPREWKGLALSSDWIAHKDPYKREVARGSMRVLDTLRAKYSGIPNIHVEEILPMGLSPKNQAFVFGKE